MQAAVIILSYNSSSQCALLAENLLKHLGDSYGVLLIDNASRDVSALEQFVQERGGRICDEAALTGENFDTRLRLIRRKENTGYASGNNAGLRWLRSQNCPFAFIANPDVSFPSYDVFPSLLECLRRNPRIATTGPEICAPDGSRQLPAQRTDLTWALGNFLYPLSFWGRKIRFSLHRHFQKWLPCYYGTGCFFAMDLAKTGEVDFFDEHTFLYFEEAILAEKLRARGYQFAYHPHLQVIHHHLFKADWAENPILQTSGRYYREKYLRIPPTAQKIIHGSEIWQQGVQHLLSHIKRILR